MAEATVAVEGRKTENNAGGPSLQEQAGKFLGQLSGFVGTRTIALGVHAGLLDALAKQPDGLTAEELARATRLDPFYTEVWCRAALAAEIVDRVDGEAYTLAPHVQTLFLDPDAPGYMAGTFTTIVQPEVFDRFGANFKSGERLWWDGCGPDFIRGVSLSGRAFYTRLVNSGMAKVPGLPERLAQGGTVLELACGAGAGVVKLLRAYPKIRVVGWDGDAYSLGLARKNVKDAGLEGRAEFVEAPLEKLDRKDAFDAVTINISMHECRDIEKVAHNVHRALKPNGVFVVSDFPFPETTAGLRTAPGRVMAGIQFFEALIGDQLLPTKAFVELLGRHGFKDVGSFDVTPVHAVTHGRK